MNRFIATILAVMLMAATSHADVYNDATGDLNNGDPNGTTTDFTGFTHLDIVSVEITNDATDITFTVTLNGDISTATGTDWGKYMVGIDSSSSSPGDPNSNGWGRPINMPDGMDYWLGSWVDTGGGHQVWNYNDTNPGNWDNPAGNEAVDLSAAASGEVSFTASLSELGLSVGDMIWFDVYSSGGGGTDSAVDALSTSSPSITGWSGPFTSPGQSGLDKYTVIPEPATLALLGLSGLAIGAGLMRRRK